MKSQTEALEHASVRQYCKAVRMPTIAANFLALAEQAAVETMYEVWREEAHRPKNKIKTFLRRKTKNQKVRAP